MTSEHLTQSVSRVLAVHDLSGFGHTSLLAVIPLYNRLGLRVCALPTAILSANTDYPAPRWLDFSPWMESFAAHWEQLGLDFAAVHTGFLASPEQAELVLKAISRLRSDQTIILVDPVMADHGQLYSCYTGEMITALRGLSACADVVTPNFTEAALLAGADPLLPAVEADILDWCTRISALGPRGVVITSVPAADADLLEVVRFDAESRTLERWPFTPSPGPQPGAGDCFSALLLAGMTKGFTLDSSISAAVGIMNQAIDAPLPTGADRREGVPLEEVLRWDLQSFYL